MQNKFEQITLSEAKEKYTLDFFPYYIEDVYQDKLITVFHDDMIFDSLDIDDKFFTTSIGGCIFLKSLTVDTSLIQAELYFGPLFIVFGDIKAKSIFIGGSECFFRGNVVAEDVFIAGVYNHGMLDIKGEIITKVLYSYDHAFSYPQNRVHAQAVMINEEGDNSLDGIFLSDYIDDGSLNETNILAAMRLGKSIIKEGTILTKQEKLFFKAESTGFTKLDLDNFELTELPDFVGDYSTWVEIILDRNNCPILPSYFSKFSELKELSLYYCDYKELPKVVTEIVSLEALDLNSNYLSSLPDEFVKLNNLQTLSLQNCQFSSVPQILTHLSIRNLNLSNQQVEHFIMEPIESVRYLNLKGNKGLKLLGEFPNLETLDISACQLLEFPLAIFKSTKLKKLCLQSNSMISEFVPEMSQLTELEELKFSRNIGGLEHLRHLKKLRKISITGFDATNEFIEALLTLENWVDIELDELFTQDKICRILERPNLQRFYYKGMEELPINKLREQMAAWKTKNLK
ncbi:leucine-rich repeat domain-containing protein [Thorsellia anophelis]|uniref:Disease resistance R13L4/SHOC-2-like LRR domain-containing protein n=1 Tax=Thorsellia anophelis DSM 18579 TaxID=1123402 RepID=A0A1I0EFU7_9GAMM|nr:hypothetical protein [Thorsellia anophelis]SET43898.1 hypothetical protein SAMN02583745_02360 [Thorsellia anophelis DSM 18579]